MLESLRQCPSSMAADISPHFHRLSLLSNLAVIAFAALLCLAARQVLVVRLQLSLGQILAGTSALVLGITAALYIYYVYIVDSGPSVPLTTGRPAAITDVNLSSLTQSTHCFPSWFVLSTFRCGFEGWFQKARLNQFELFMLLIMVKLL